MEASGGHGNDPRTASNHGAARDGLGVKRFSAILFSDFKREGHMMKHGNYKGMWKEGHEAAVIYK